MSSTPVTMTYREACRQALRDALQADPRCFVMGEDVGRYGGCYAVTKGLLEEFGPGRIRDTPLAENGFVGAGVGAALAGLRPIVEIMTCNFSLLALDQIMNNAASLAHMSGGQFAVPLVIRMATGAGRQLAAQHSQSLEAWFCHVPGLKVIAPATPHDAKGLLTSAIRDPNPVIFIEAQLLYGTKGEVQEGTFEIPIGKADIKRQGTDLTIVAYSKMLAVALEAADTLAQEGIEAEVVDPRTLKPLDVETIAASVQKTGHLLIVEEGWGFAGLGAQIAHSVSRAAFDYLDGPVVRVTGENVPMPYTRPLEDAAIPDSARVVKTVHRMLNRSS